ncbi:C2H2 type zinc finger domain protein [Aspergillus fischeri NRRL 181]|uniref:C2H2 type zinc finger domain protein n=1 Tax=Neosartorya fischeri (strain ATCC 1020 / DSM 3700 / CBS 544.65 / FGSC A1164 / JCM 1740 / NRRL 181 / WB 181) TaxID=331117 RepID=A1DKJ5_NEOFI|nr:C2H2 type zinc finger domain protein [Aspergillus fischeri NRRL 181]EAW17234.1 C2H2 type zinc finger domain protein [Aspergillus fischeri NRRL 181]KAG2004092.1 hypothetical protein GB937_009109 [Aspergillus fischeri]
MMGDSTRLSGPSLSESYLECIQLFGSFLLALSEEDCRAIRLEQVHLSDILEEYGRAKIWGDQVNAQLPARARGSLDDTLRHDNELKGLVQAILMRLRALLGQGKSHNSGTLEPSSDLALATYIARRKYDPVAGSDRDSISSVSADSDSDLDDYDEHQRHRVPKIRLLVQQVLEQVRSLYELSALLRRPKIADKYIRSVNSKSNIATLSDRDSLPLNVCFGSSDEGHIVEKVLQWRGLTKSARCVEFEDEAVAPVGQAVTNDCVEDILWFCQRLAGANTRRREQLQYWTDHPYDPKEDTATVARLATPNLAQVHAEQVEEKQEPRSQVSTFKPSNLDVSRKGSNSAVSKQSFSTAAVSDIRDTKTDVRPRTVYAPTAIGQGGSNSVPDLPKMEDGKLTFPCPYCGMTLESREMQNRQSWKRHVFRDLRPYVCTFQDCANAGKLYVSRRDWIYHELQIHRREFVCKECYKRCPSRNEMSTHLREHYGESIPPAQLSVILDLCDHQVDVSDYEKTTCFVCGEELSLSALQGHLAAHMEDIALFVLPNTSEEEETGDSRASVQVAKLNSKGKNNGTESEASSLGFSAAGVYRQTPADFSKLLTSEEAGYSSKFWSWRTTDGDHESVSIKAVAARLEYPDRDMRRAAVQALGDQSVLPEEILRILTARLEYPVGDGRRNTIQALVDQSALPEEILKAVAACLTYPVGDVRYAAVQALGSQSALPEEILKAVVALLEDPDRDVRRAAVQALGAQSVLPDEILKISLDYLNSLIDLLGEKKDYKNLAWLLAGLWKQMINLSPAMGLQLTRRYILATYLAGDVVKATRLAEDIVYNYRRVYGARDWSTLEMSTLLSQLYTDIAERYQSAKDDQHLANKYYERSASVHEDLLRRFAESDGSDDDLDLTDTAANDARVSDGEHIRQHLLLLKLALQRLGDWPKDYGEYERLNAGLFLAFGNELKGFEGVEKWNLKDFGGGKAASNEDRLDLGFKSWGLDLA